MEVASPLPFTPGQAGTKRAFSCSPGLVDSSAPAVGMEISDDYGQQSFKRRRFNDQADIVQPHSFNPFAAVKSASSLSNGISIKRYRTDSNQSQGFVQDLNLVVQEQAQEIASLKHDKAALDSTVHELRVENERVVHENKILKRAVTIQQERQNHAASEIEAARNYKAEADDRMKKLENMIMTLRYHLQAQHSNPGNDFMDFTQRPPDVY